MLFNICNHVSKKCEGKSSLAQNKEDGDDCVFYADTSSVIKNWSLSKIIFLLLKT